MNYLTMLTVSRALLASNARGEGEGNTQTLQHITVDNRDHTILTGYSMRRGMRQGLLDNDSPMWRKHNAVPESPSGYGYGPNNSSTMKDALPSDPRDYVDTSLFGLMAALKGILLKFRSQAQVSAAISTVPYYGDVAFGQGPSDGKDDGGGEDEAPKKGKGKGKVKAPGAGLALFHYEQHYTRYAFTITLNLQEMKKAGTLVHLKHLLNVLTEIQVGGSQAANAASIIPEAILWTFHKSSGKGGLQVGIDKLRGSASEPINLAPIAKSMADVGATYEVCGNSVCDITIVEGLRRIWEQAQS